MATTSWLDVPPVLRDIILGLLQGHARTLAALRCSCSKLREEASALPIRLMLHGCYGGRISHALDRESKWAVELDLSEARLTALQLANLPRLEGLNVSSNRLSSLVLSDSSLTGLVWLAADSNSLTQLEFRTDQQQLQQLSIIRNHLNILPWQVLYLSGLQELDCSSNNLFTLDQISNLSLLTSLKCSANRLQHLDLKNLTNLRSLDCSHNQLEDIELSSSLQHINISRNWLRSLDLSCCAASLTWLHCGDNRLSTLQLAGLTALQSLQCPRTWMSTLNCNGLAQLQFLCCRSISSLNWLHLRGCTQLVHLYCSRCCLVCVDLTDQQLLWRLDCSQNRLTELLLLSPHLEELVCYGNPLAELSIERCAALATLHYTDTATAALQIIHSNLANIKVLKGVPVYYLGPHNHMI